MLNKEIERELNEFLERIREEYEDYKIYITRYWDLEEYLPCVEIYEKNDESEPIKVFGYDKDNGKFVDMTEDIEDGISGFFEFGYVGFLRLDGEEIGTIIPNSYYYELCNYGNTFQLLLPYEGKVYSITGYFLDNTVMFDFKECESDKDLEKEFERVLPHVLEVLRGYYEEPLDAWRSLYRYSGNPKYFTKVVEGWVSILAGDEVIMKLSDVSKMKIKFNFPILFVFPRCSNVCVTYFDVFVPKEKVNEFKEKLKLERTDKIDLSEGFWYKVY